ncbi:ATP-dependent Clp protease ATP-binding subunit clpA-like protein chloroplastic-like [Quillaja saponaria]|uniref:ATP-dependent Clp protease ATP-binding subunit clpA-like protein chloroplastic-like n=1 Tax=Quillaja saponaria TaxID=32244 RepID=A0AAD7PN78_QUISA|nr:ATP-dependent Clp protease ATP-binding subunit clpA-like protein chloroplastic-like [Quillaja saponaria]
MSKSNPRLIGEPGVGIEKTAIAEGLSQRLANGDAPQYLKGKKVVSVNIPHLVSGTIYVGQFEERMKNLMDEIEKCGDIILFIDEGLLLPDKAIDLIDKAGSRAQILHAETVKDK